MRSKDLNAITGFSADEPVLTGLCNVSMDEFVDWENGTCEFEGEYFKDVLAFAKEYTGNYTGGTYLERIRNTINEEAAAYFSGQVDIDKTVEKIQNRVSLLLQE